VNFRLRGGDICIKMEKEKMERSNAT